MSRRSVPVPSRRLAVVRGPMPASISIAPDGARITLQFPFDPEARMHKSRGIRFEPNQCELFGSRQTHKKITVQLQAFPDLRDQQCLEARLPKQFTRRLFRKSGL